MNFAKNLPETVRKSLIGLNNKNQMASTIPNLQNLAASVTSISTMDSMGDQGEKPIFVCCGPSGVGKSTLIKRLMKEFPDRFGFSVSHTTRGARPGEVDGKDYHFIQKEEFQEKIANGDMVEHACVHKNYYGTSIESVRNVTEEGRRCILDIDVQGVDLVKASDLNPSCAYVFVVPPSIEELEARLRSRGTECEERIQTRLGNARKELEYQNKEPEYWDATVVNGDIESAYMQFRSILVPESVRSGNKGNTSTRTSACEQPGEQAV